MHVDVALCERKENAAHVDMGMSASVSSCRCTQSPIWSLWIDDFATRAPTDQRGKTRLRDAQAFIMEHRLQKWVATHNERHGLAPTVGDALQHRDELAAAVQVQEMQPSPLWSVASSARYKWSARFRKRWRVGLKKPHAREAVPLGVARQKAIPINRKGQTPSQFGMTKCFTVRMFASYVVSPL